MQISLLTQSGAVQGEKGGKEETQVGCVVGRLVNEARNARCNLSVISRETTGCARPICANNTRRLERRSSPSVSLDSSPRPSQLATRAPASIQLPAVETSIVQGLSVWKRPTSSTGPAQRRIQSDTREVVPTQPRPPCPPLVRLSECIQGHTKTIKRSSSLASLGKLVPRILSRLGNDERAAPGMHQSVIGAVIITREGTPG